MTFAKVLSVGCGGFLGAALRYIISGSTEKYFGNFPIGTLIVNVLGGFLMGFLMIFFNDYCPVPHNAKIFVMTGIMGGLTTFSTFSYETISMFNNGKFLMGGFNAGINLFASLFACWLGSIVATSVGKMFINN